MSDNVFFDTNVLIYILVSNDARRVHAEKLFLDGGVVSVQVLNEFADVARRKLRRSWDEVREVLAMIRTRCPKPVAITIDLHERALKIAERYGFRIYDATIVASATEAKCSVLYSEDFRDGQVIEGMRIRNPFAGRFLSTK